MNRLDIIDRALEDIERTSQRERGYHHRCCGLPPESADSDFFSGYCERLCEEIADENIVQNS